MTRLAVLLFFSLLGTAALAQTPATPPGAPEDASAGATAGSQLPSLPGAKGQAQGLQAMAPSATMLQVPVSSLIPGGVPARPSVNLPAADPKAVQRGMQAFSAFNCIGCHADNGGGGMGPSLSNWTNIYGEQPENIFLTIKQGRPNGMPSWGATLPDSTIWDLVAYVRNLREPTPKTFGHTISRTPPSPDTEQTPTEYELSLNPWQHTETFSTGQKPNAH
jgi:cytochrome c oxidase cbb3-type subunit 3